MDALEAWTQANGITLLTDSSNQNVQTFYVSKGFETIQIVVECKAQECRIDVWSVELANDEELHYVYIVPEASLTEEIDLLVKKVTCWFSDRNSLP